MELILGGTATATATATVGSGSVSSPIGRLMMYGRSHKRWRSIAAASAGLKGAEAIVGPDVSRMKEAKWESTAETEASRATDGDGDSGAVTSEEEYRQPPSEVGNPLHFYLPPVSCSTPALLHPLYHSARRSCDSWLLSTLKPQNPAYAQFLVQSLHPLFVCLTMPHALHSRILPLCKIVAWLFVLDNFSDELLLMSGDSVSEKDYYDHVISLLQHGHSSISISNPELSTMSDVFLGVWHEIQSQMSVRQQNRFVDIMKDIFDATLQQSDNREEQGIVDLQTYLSFRKYTGEGYAFMIMSEFGTGLDMEEEVLQHPDIAKLQELVAYHVAYVNDLLSFRKEFCLGHHQNLPAILCVHEGYNLQESIFRVCRMIQGLDDEFVSLKKKISINSELMARQGVQEYMDVLGYVMSGFLEWAYQTGRYHGLNNHLTLRHGLVSLVHLDFTLITQGLVKSELFAD